MRGHGIEASLIVPCWNAVEYTRECLGSVARWTTGGYEVIAVDNGSTDGTAEYLAALQRRFPAPLKVLRNGANLGFPRAVNQGAAAAKGKYRVWLNNDVVVTPGWLGRLAACAESEPRVGAVGPYTNVAPGAQRLAPIPYGTLAELPAFAQAWALSHAGRARPLKRLAGFCLLVTRKAALAIGELDERFGIGCYEDYDYCARLRRAGFEVMLAQDVFVHHHGHRTFIANKVGLVHARRSRDAFRLKWGYVPTA